MTVTGNKVLETLYLGLGFLQPSYVCLFDGFHDSVWSFGGYFGSCVRGYHWLVECGFGVIMCYCGEPFARRSHIMLPLRNLPRSTEHLQCVIILLFRKEPFPRFMPNIRQLLNSIDFPFIHIIYL